MNHAPRPAAPMRRRPFLAALALALGLAPLGLAAQPEGAQARMAGRLDGAPGAWQGAKGAAGSFERADRGLRVHLNLEDAQSGARLTLSFRALPGRGGAVQDVDLRLLPPGAEAALIATSSNSDIALSRLVLQDGRLEVAGRLDAILLEGGTEMLVDDLLRGGAHHLVAIFRAGLPEGPPPAPPAGERTAEDAGRTSGEAGAAAPSE